MARRGLVALRHSPRLATLTFALEPLLGGEHARGTSTSAPFYASRGASDTALGFILGTAMLMGALFSWIGGHIGMKIPMPLAVGGADHRGRALR